jgi:hypothetical protein
VAFLYQKWHRTRRVFPAPRGVAERSDIGVANAEEDSPKEKHA